LSEELEQYNFDFHHETAEIVRDGSEELKIKIGEFAGPLDLLLFLIKQEQANIFDIPIAKITQKYLEYIQIMKKLDIAVAADFLVMAATLIEIKSRMLLPRDPKAVEEEEFEDPRQELVDRLLEYEKFKSAAGMLYERTTIEQAIFTRGEIAREEISLADMIKTLKARILELGEVNLFEFFEGMRSKHELVTAFIAVLEIVRTETVRLLQKTTFGDIILRKV